MALVKIILTAAAALVVLVPSGVALSFQSGDGLRVPEKLNFELKWLGLKAGTCIMEVERLDEDSVRIVSTTKSADWVSVFYPVEDRVESLLHDSSGWYPVHYRLKTREGGSRKDKEVVFHHSEGKAEYTDYLKKEQKTFDVPEGIFDPLSSLYYIRAKELVVGASSYVPVFDSKRVWNVEVKVLKKERIKVPAGSFDTILIKPLLQSEGIFSRKGDIYIWLTDDARRVPVKVKSKVAVGSIVAELRKVEY